MYRIIALALIMLIAFAMGACAPRARSVELEALRATAMLEEIQPPMATPAREQLPERFESEEWGYSFDVPAGFWGTIEAQESELRDDSGVRISILALKRSLSKRSYRSELTQLRAALKEAYDKLSYERSQPYFEVHGYSGIEVIFSGVERSGGQRAVKVHQMVFLRGEREYIFVLECAGEQFDAAEETFERLINSIAFA